jgi:RNA polymerase sigma-70 factor (ECF subfamily)
VIASWVPRYVRRARLWVRGQFLKVCEADVPDVTQDALCKIARAWSSRDPSRGLQPWVKTIAVHAAHDHLRKRARRPEELDPEPEPAVREPGTDLSRDECLAILLDLLRPMKDTRRIVFLLYELDGFTMDEIADALGIRPNTAYSRLRRARQELTERAERWRSTASGAALLAAPVRARPGALDPPPEHAAAHAEDDALAEQYREILVDLLRPMDEGRRVVFTLSELDGFTMKQIAEMMQIPLDTARDWLHDAWTEIAEHSARVAPTSFRKALARIGKLVPKLLRQTRSLRHGGSSKRKAAARGGDPTGRLRHRPAPSRGSAR